MQSVIQSGIQSYSQPSLDQCCRSVRFGTRRARRRFSNTDAVYLSLSAVYLSLSAVYPPFMLSPARWRWPS
eukprot:7893538-Pyramimonas_sp.AAC.1